MGDGLVPEAMNRSEFLWHQQLYVMESIKLADTKAGFVLTISAALLSTNLLPSGRLAVHLERATTGRGWLVDSVDVVGIGLLAGAVLLSVWAILPRLRSHPAASPVSWVNVAQYADAASFQRVNREMTEEVAADYLCEQVFHNSRICVRKHRLVHAALMLAAGGACCIAVALAGQ